MKNAVSKILIILLIATGLFSCDDDSIFDIKVKNVNGVTTVSGIRPGGLERALIITAFNIKKLAINDTIDSRDFITIRDRMPGLEFLDLSHAVIAAYNGYGGTAGNMNYYYPKNVIPPYAFYNPATSVGKSKLTTVLLPNNITSVYDFAFTACGLSGDFVLPPSVKDTIGISAFANCTNLTHLSIPNVSYIGSSAFQNCSSLTGELTIPRTVTALQSWTFAFCPLLTTISLPESVTDISKTAFSGSGTSFTVDAQNTSFIAVNGVLFNKNVSSLIQYPGQKQGNYVVPPSVQDIAPYAFAYNAGLTSVAFPDGLNFIEDRAFYDCSSMSGNISLPSALIFIGTEVFENCNLITGFTTPSSNSNFLYSDGVLEDLGQSTLKRCITSKSGTYSIPSNIIYVDNSAFSNCAGITSVLIPETVQGIGNRAFYGCTSLTSVTVKATVPIDLSKSTSAFESLKLKNLTLHVPAGASQKYSNAAVWNQFGKIVEN